MERKLRAVLARTCATTLLAAGGGAAIATPTPAGQAATTTGTTTTATLNSSDVTANLWEWNWTSVGRACTQQLGPAGYGAVQVAPPEESVSLPSTPDGAHPWYEVYQPVSYHLTSRLGKRAQFAAMVTACHDAGVRVYVDAVINHTAGDNNTVTSGYGGSTFNAAGYGYPAIPYSYADFHHPNDGYCPDADGQIDDGNNVAEVQNCELVHLSDLKTQSSAVRATIAAYLNDLIGLGVDGFRVDAAKHIAQDDFAQIRGLLHTTTAEGKAPYIAQEVVPGGSGQLAPSAFTTNGDILGFSYADGLKAQFTAGTLSNLAGIPSWNLDASSDRTYAMVTNHDTERDGSTLRYADGRPYLQATEFLLAYPYGKPVVFDGFTFPAAATGQSPPAAADGMVSDTDCSTGAWQCVTQSTAITGMVAWHNTVHDAAGVADFTSTSGSVIGFHRGALGWVGLNGSGSASTASYATGLPDGTYCDRITGGVTGRGCAGTTVTVTGGRATVTIPAGGAVAIDVHARAGGRTPPACTSVAVTFDATVTTVFGENVYVLGDQPALSTWDTAGGLALSAATYPVWTGTVTLPANTTVQYKYVKKNGSAVTWESGGNRTFSTGSSCTLTRTDTWK